MKTTYRFPEKAFKNFEFVVEKDGISCFYYNRFHYKETWDWLNINQHYSFVTLSYAGIIRAYKEHKKSLVDPSISPNAICENEY